MAKSREATMNELQAMKKEELMDIAKTFNIDVATKTKM
jgi:hypothetical protein